MTQTSVKEVWKRIGDFSVPTRSGSVQVARRETCLHHNASSLHICIYLPLLEVLYKLILFLSHSHNPWMIPSNPKLRLCRNLLSTATLPRLCGSLRPRRGHPSSWKVHGKDRLCRVLLSHKVVSLLGAIAEIVEIRDLP